MPRTGGRLLTVECRRWRLGLVTDPGGVDLGHKGREEGFDDGVVTAGALRPIVIRQVLSPTTAVGVGAVRSNR